VAPEARAPKLAPLPRMDVYGFDREDMQRALEKAREAKEFMKNDFKYEHDREALLEHSRMAAEQARHLSENQRMFTEDAKRMAAQTLAENRIHIEEARRLAENAMTDQRFYIEDAKRFAEDRAFGLFQGTPKPMPSMAPMPMPFRYSEDAFGVRPPAPWAQGDPADSLYKVGYEAHNRGDYRRAAQVFADLVQRFPQSSYVGDAMYWEAFDRYRLGSTEELRTAAKVLETMTARAATLRRRGNSDGDVQGLKARIYAELARRGDNDASAKLQREVAQAGGTLCDREDQAVRAEALSALAQIDPAAANPIFKKVFDRKDECSSQLRSNAVNILGRRTDAEAVTLLITVAKVDPNYDVRTQAIQFLPRLPGDAPVAALEEILKSDTASQIQRAVVRALRSSDNPKTRLGMRSLVNRKDVNRSLRIEAIRSFDKERASPEDIAWLRSVYPTAEDDQVRDAFINTIARYGGSENEQWVIGIARNVNETSQARSSAWSAVLRLNLPISDIIKLYDAADTRNTREQIINTLGNRNEPEATDKLIEIAKTRTDARSSISAINALQRKKDPRTLRLLADILEKQP
jgi:TolA-binding protein/HEAT repeat protein